MKVIVARNAGFCRGVRRAVKIARHVASEEGSVRTDGPLIHNQEMMRQLEQEGVHETDSPHDMESGTLLIRAHGIPPIRRREFRGLPVRLVDATCPDVAQIQAHIKKYSKQGYAIIIFGDHGHAEVLGLQGYATNGCHVVSEAADVDELPAMPKVCLVSQSTQFPAAFEEVAQRVRTRFHDAVVLATICDSTRERQSEVVEIAERADVVVVVGGRHSANTCRLVEMARALKPTVHVQTADELQPVDFEGFVTAGLTAGASTPGFMIDEVRRRLESFTPADQ